MQADNDRDHRHDHRADPPIGETNSQPIPTGASYKDATPNQSNTDSERPSAADNAGAWSWEDRLSLFFDGLITVATVVGVVFLVFQWNQTEQALTEAKAANELTRRAQADAVQDAVAQQARYERQLQIAAETATAVKDAADLARLQMVTEMRPYLSIASGWGDLTQADSELVPTFANKGRTPARSIRVCVIAEILEQDEQARFAIDGDDPRCQKYDWPTLRTGESMPRAVFDIYRSMAGRKEIWPGGDDVTLWALHSGARWLAFHGRVEYVDMFNANHLEEFCEFTTDFQSRPRSHTLRPNDPAQRCMAHNKVDTNTGQGQSRQPEGQSQRDHASLSR